MCGITGFISFDGVPEKGESVIREMISCLLHRGPDEIGYFIDDLAAFGTARLSIIDLGGGSQPVSDETGRWWIAYNGEVYNYIELRRELEARGRRFKTSSDTEVVLQAWLEWGANSLPMLNGGYAFCIYDSQSRTVALVRDRFGKRPLYYATFGSNFLFSSEMKAFSAFPGWTFRWDKEALKSVFADWTPLPGDGCYENVQQVLPGSWLQIQNRELSRHRYWSPDPSPAAFSGTYNQAQEAIRDLLAEAVKLRLRSDVEVGTYLSGGLDSAAVTRLAQNYTDRKIHTFSVAFQMPDFDESVYQRTISKALDTEHHVLKISLDDISENFPAALDHCEYPVFRTAFVPLYLLSGVVHDQGVKVVLTGEGADEAFLGYDIFKEAFLLENWAGMDALKRQEFLLKMYPYLKHFTQANVRFLLPLYERQAQDRERWNLSHSMRLSNSSLSLRQLAGCADAESRLQKHLESRYPQFSQLPAVLKAQLIEYETLLAGYLLSSQGDRASLAHSVENRCPFLDYRVFELAASLPLDWRLPDGLKEKQILKDAFADLLPPEISRRFKQPYRAPDAVSFLSSKKADYVSDALSTAELAKISVLDAGTASRFVEMIKTKPADKISQAENQAFLLLLSLSLLNRSFVDGKRDFRNPAISRTRATVIERRLSKKI